MKQTPPLIGTSKTNSMDLPPNTLGDPGSVGHLVVAAMFKDDRYLGIDRYNDTSDRSFEIKARLSKLPYEQGDINGNIAPENGASFFLLPNDKTHIEIGLGSQSILLSPNANRELAMASAVIDGNSPHAARLSFENLLAPCLDRLSYLRCAPIHVALITVRDIKNEVQYIYYRAPARRSVVDDHEETLFEQLKPVYALYREAQNSSSPYYRVLCFYKVMEGLLGSLQVSLRASAVAAGKAVQVPKAKVPDHPNISHELRTHIGTPMKVFFDNFLTKAHRDAVAHFELTNSDALNVSSAWKTENFARVSFLADVCVRSLIARHEAALRELFS